MNLDELRQLCLSFPGAEEEVKWEHDLCFMVGKKMFCITGFEEPVRFSIKTDDEDFAFYTDREGIKPAAYLGRYKWISIQDLSAVRMDEAVTLIRKSYELIAAGIPGSKRPVPKTAGSKKSEKSQPEKKKTAVKKSPAVSQKLRSSKRKTLTKPSSSLPRKKRR